MMKVCSVCKKEKPISEYPLDRHNKNGYMARCSECKNKAQCEARARKRAGLPPSGRRGRGSRNVSAYDELIEAIYEHGPIGEKELSKKLGFRAESRLTNLTLQDAPLTYNGERVVIVEDERGRLMLIGA
jgi:hypothetical protein